MDFTNELLAEVTAALSNEQRTLAGLTQKRETNPEAADILDPLIAKLQELCAHLEKLRTDLRMSAVANRT